MGEGGCAFVGEGGREGEVEGDCVNAHIVTLKGSQWVSSVGKKMVVL